MEHHFNIEFAKLYGIEEAIIVHNLYFWIIKNIANNVHEHNGKFWTYNSNNAFVALFPYMNKTKICRVMAHLESEGIIIKDNFNKDNRDRTLWYSFADEGINILNDCGYDISKMTKCTVQNELCKIQNEPPLPYNKQTNNKQEYKKENIDNKLSIKEKKEKSFSKKERIDYDAIVKCWNETNPTLSSVRMLNDKRKKQIRTLLASNNATVDDSMKAIKIISMSSFCQGKNDRNWRASFDWLIKDTKSCFSRLFEGVYAFTQDEKNKLSQYIGQTANGGNPTSLNGWTKEQYDMYIRNGYTIADDGLLLKDGMFYK